MKKIGILTRRAGYNMGSSLQAYAMARFIKETGFECRIIDYDEYSGHPIWKVRPFIENIQWSLVKHLPFKEYIGKFSYLLARSQQYERFRLFEQEFLPLTSRKYRNAYQLAELLSDFDVLVCGSDQIWCPLLYDPVYFFDFLPSRSSIRTIAYAPSIGISDISLVSKKQASLMKKVDWVSCREQQGAEMIEELTGRKIPVVLDPTLMVEVTSWNELARPVEYLTDTPYLLCYFLGNDMHQSFIEKLGKRLHCKIVNIRMFNRFNNLKADYQLTDIGPCEFLGLIKNADWICTDSYHGTIFSFIFQKKISIFERFKASERDNQNSRIYTLLKNLAFQKALVLSDDAEVDIEQKFYTNANTVLLKKWKETSLEFINKALR